MLLPILGLLVGLTLGWTSTISVPLQYAHYLSIALLAALDSIFGGVRAYLEENYDNYVFMSGFFGNIILAALLVNLGERFGVDLYLAAIFAFGVRLFQNLAIMRRILLNKFFSKK
ncbi:small basic family protein [Alkalicella caledoniensis]|uniref:Small basic family protein n=1 Tax=Alkalicella caledoniensis TaxID=2731377 RepID=A0A7G9WC98_ALKCA|nr:small basic family protein [Alkalicella caledoniensis]QNO16310.1 small basic family protein [Alkalicella caledoniensis]